jgi:hypothetical protein
VLAFEGTDLPEAIILRSMSGGNGIFGAVVPPIGTGGWWFGSVMGAVLEVDTRRELTDTRIVGLGQSKPVGLAVEYPNWPRILRWHEPSPPGPPHSGVLRMLKNSPRISKLSSFTNGELLEERHIHQWVKLLTNVENGAVALRGSMPTLNGRQGLATSHRKPSQCCTCSPVSTWC